MLPACTTTLKPFVVGSQNSASVYADSAADSPGSACQLFAATTGNILRSVNAESCSIAAVTNAYPIAKQCDPLMSTDPYSYANGAALMAFAFIGVMACYFAAHGIGLVVKAVRDM